MTKNQSINQSRGRHSGRYLLPERKALETIMDISWKYSISPKELFHAFVRALECRNEITFEKLTIKCRKKTKTHAIFLVSSDSEIVAQFPVSRRVLKEIAPFEGFLYEPRLRSRLPSFEEGEIRIKDLRMGMKHISLKVTVMEKLKAKVIYSRYSYAAHRVADSIISDETGSIKLTLWNEQIDSISVGDTVQLEDVHVITFRGEKKLSLHRKSGKLSVIPNHTK